MSQKKYYVCRSKLKKMKKLFSIVTFSFGLLVFCSCTHECSCTSVSDISAPGRHEIYNDTLKIDSRGDCSLMNVDTTYIISRRDTLGQEIESGIAHEITICE